MKTGICFCVLFLAGSLSAGQLKPMSPDQQIGGKFTTHLLTDFENSSENNQPVNHFFLDLLDYLEATQVYLDPLFQNIVETQQYYVENNQLNQENIDKISEKIKSCDKFSLRVIFKLKFALEWLKLRPNEYKIEQHIKDAIKNIEGLVNKMEGFAEKLPGILEKVAGKTNPDPRYTIKGKITTEAMRTECFPNKINKAIQLTKEIIGNVNPNRVNVYKLENENIDSLINKEAKDGSSKSEEKKSVKFNENPVTEVLIFKSKYRKSRLFRRILRSIIVSILDKKKKSIKKSKE